MNANSSSDSKSQILKNLKFVDFNSKLPALKTQINNYDNEYLN